MRHGHILSIGLFFSTFIPLANGAQWTQIPNHSLSIGSGLGHLNSSARMSSMGTIQPSGGSTLLLGRGFNSVNGEVGGPCVEVGAVDTMKSDPGNSTGQKVTLSMQEIKSVDDLQQQLEISPSGSLGLGVWKGDIKSKFYRSSTYNENNYYLMLKVTVENQTEVLKDYQLTASASDLYVHQGKEAFLRACGDQFVADRVTGGEFVAILEIETHSAEEKHSISAEVNAAGVYWSAQSSLSNTLAKISKQNRTSLTLFRSGDSGDLPSEDPQKLIEYALSFPSKVMNHSAGAWPFLVGTESYDVILDKPSTDLIHLDGQQRIISKLAQDQEKAKLLLNSIESVLANSNSFVSPDLNTLESVDRNLKDILNDIQDAAATCGADLLNGCKLPDLKWPEIHLPTRKPLVMTTPPPSPSRDDSSDDSSDSSDVSNNAAPPQPAPEAAPQPAPERSEGTSDDSGNPFDDNDFAVLG